MGDGARGMLLAPSPGLGDSSFRASLFPDEDRLSKRKSIGETISLQVEVESRNSPEGGGECPLLDLLSWRSSASLGEGTGSTSLPVGQTLRDPGPLTALCI